MAALRTEWFVAGGWAIDLFLGERTRDHEDVDIAIARDQQSLARRLMPGWNYQKVVPRGEGLVREHWPEDEWLSLPVHEIHAESAGGSHLEFLLLERHGDDWVYRRDSRVTLPWRQLAVRSGLGVTALAPEVVLLFKAKGRRERDQADFDVALPRLNGRRRVWLRVALEVAHPEHRWINALHT
jgi:hypothetical protein